MKGFMHHSPVGRQIGTSLTAALLLCATARATFAQIASEQQRFDSGRTHEYVSAIVGPLALLGVVASSALDQVRDDPAEWQGSSGFGKRAASNEGRLIIQETVHYGLAAAMSRSTWYHPCTCRSGGSRFGHAFAEAFTDRDRSGHGGLSVSRIAGAYSGAFAQKLWRPGVSTQDAIITGTGTLVFTGVVNLWREFVR